MEAPVNPHGRTSIVRSDPAPVLPLINVSLFDVHQICVGCAALDHRYFADAKIAVRGALVAAVRAVHANNRDHLGFLGVSTIAVRSSVGGNAEFISEVDDMQPGAILGYWRIVYLVIDRTISAHNCSQVVLAVNALLGSVSDPFNDLVVLIVVNLNNSAVVVLRDVADFDAGQAHSRAVAEISGRHAEVATLSALNLQQCRRCALAVVNKLVGDSHKTSGRQIRGIGDGNLGCFRIEHEIDFGRRRQLHTAIAHGRGTFNVFSQ
jgi:hypothetical protein